MVNDAVEAVRMNYPDFCESGSFDILYREIIRLGEAERDAAAARDDFSAATQEGHSRLDGAGIASAQNALCDDPTCHTKLGHRVKMLVVYRDRLAADLTAAQATIAALTEAILYEITGLVTEQERCERELSGWEIPRGRVVRLRAALSSPDVEKWARLIEAVRDQCRTLASEESGPRECELAVSAVRDAARAAGIGGGE